jgi:hypothetical protein
MVSTEVQNDMSIISEPSYVAHLLRNTLDQLEQATPAGLAVLRHHTPYCLHFEDDWCLPLNRSYKPVGMPGNTWVDYDSPEYDSLRFDAGLVNCRPGEINAQHLYLASPLCLRYKRDRDAYLIAARRVMEPLLATCDERWDRVA